MLLGKVHHLRSLGLRFPAGKHPTLAHSLPVGLEHDTNGILVLDFKYLRSDAPHQGRRFAIPIIAVTSYALSGEGQKARVAGCDDYVPKPFSPRQLLAKIRQYLS